MTRATPHVVGIAGPSGAGKTVLSKALLARLPAGASRLPLDAYYRDRPVHAPRDALGVNFDHPGAIDLPLLVAHLEALAHGEAVLRPVYDFSTHRRRTETRPVAAARFIVVEGLLTFHWETVRALCHTRIYVEADDALRLARRIARDVRDRGRTEPSVRRQWITSVQPMTRRYVVPTRRFAHAVVDAREPADRIAASITRRFGW